MSAVSNAVSIDAPTEGWDAFHSLDNMPPNAAVILDNLIPGAGRVDGRGGFVEFADLGTGLPVETVASLNSMEKTQLVVASDGGLWHIEATGNLTPFGTRLANVTQISARGTFQNSRWQTENFTEGDEDGIIVFANGEDDVQIYDGTSVRDINITGSDPAIPTTFIGAMVFKGRMYYWMPKDNAFYYSEAGAYQGIIKKFDLGTQIQKGGTITSIVSWTQQDSGDGKDDFIVFIFSTGEVLVYQGDDPDTYFELVGRYMMGEPMSVRGNERYGADAIIMTQDGYVNLSSVIQQGRTGDVPQFSRLIYNAVTERTQSRGHLYGWECTLFPRKGLFIFNVPLSPETFEQHVMNTVTQRWCRFKGLNVNCMAVHEEKLYGGTQDGKVIWMLESTSDNGQAIQFTGMPAFNYFDNPGMKKHLMAVNVISSYAQPGNIAVSGWADFNVPTILPELNVPPRYTPSSWAEDPPTPPSIVGSYWDEDYWSEGETPFTTQGWQNVSAYGYAVTVLIRFAEGSDPVLWRSTGIRYFQAGAH